jgi:hypothetical protein
VTDLQCGICGDYTVRGVEVHSYCLAATAALLREAAPDLDVERLARAMDNLYERRWGPGPFPGQTTINLEYAEAIAREYALAETLGKPE